jgi:hypothetical protein
MAKLDERKVRWIIQEKLRGRGAGELALIQRVSRRRIEQLWQAYKPTGFLPALKKPGRPKKAPMNLRDAALILDENPNQSLPEEIPAMEKKHRSTRSNGEMKSGYNTKNLSRER